MTDSEHSDAEVSFTDNGTFNLSRGQTPLTEGSEGGCTGVAHLKGFRSHCVTVSHRVLDCLDQILTDTVTQRSPSLKTLQTSPQLTPMPL